jgi:lipopolysaccharide biosynthesis glycosyltransferase
LSEEIKPLKIYIGWDSREDIAYQVAKHSIEKHSSVPVEIIPIKQKQLRKEGIYNRPVDALASTEFTFTRFLIPELMEFDGWALFIDCDFVALTDVAELFEQADNQYAVMCAHHDYTPKETVKMDGQLQHIYPRKNWSSMMLINCGHPSNKTLTKELVNDLDIGGAYLHRFSWLKDEEIGELSHEWNWLVGWYKEPDDGTPKFLHYTEGGPWFEQYEMCEYNHHWYKSKIDYLETTINEKNHKLEKNANKIPTINELGVSDQKKNLIHNLFNYIVDPKQNYFRNNFSELLEENMGNKVAAIDSIGGVNYQSKGYEYDNFLQSFILGSGGYISNWDKEKDNDTALVIRGLGGGSQKAIKHCWETGRDFYAIDTGYFGNQKNKRWHRVTKNALQNIGPIIPRDADRTKRIGYEYKTFTFGRKILICPPSEKVMNLWMQPDPETWTANVIEELKKYTDRPIEVRLKPSRSERVSNKTIQQALDDDVYCLITYNSIAATEALMHGKLAIALGPNAASTICNKSLSDIENLNVPDRQQMMAFVHHLSYCQFTEDEMRDGTAWRIVNESYELSKGSA